MSNHAPMRFPLLTAGFFGATGVALGALGAHSLQPLLDERGMMRTWETGARYHLFHAVALLAVAAMLERLPRGPVARLTWAAVCWCVGIVFFSGSLYWLALLGPEPRAIVYATPVGGLALLTGWILVISAAISSRGSNPDRAGQ